MGPIHLSLAHSPIDGLQGPFQVSKSITIPAVGSRGCGLLDPLNNSPGNGVALFQSIDYERHNYQILLEKSKRNLSRRKTGPHLEPSHTAPLSFRPRGVYTTYCRGAFFDTVVKVGSVHSIHWARHRQSKARTHRHHHDLSRGCRWGTRPRSLRWGSRATHWDPRTHPIHPLSLVHIPVLEIIA